MRQRISKRHKNTAPMNLEQHLEGMVTLYVHQENTDAVLKLVSSEKISLYRLVPEQNRFYFTILLDDFNRIQYLMRTHHIRFRISRKRGVPFLMSRFKRRKGIWIGLLCCVIVGKILLSFLWNYEVTGNEQYSDAHLIALVQQYGMVQGSWLDSFDYEALEHEIELAHPEFTWIQLETKGTTLCISVKERLAELADFQDSGSIIAKKNGQITELLVYNGTALVEVGDWVEKGQVLVGGWDYPNRVRNTMGDFVDSGEPFAVRAKSVVRGYTEHRAIAACALQETWLVKTGKTETGRAILWKEHCLFSIGKQRSPYPYSNDEVEIKSLFQIAGRQCPIKIRTITYEEQIAVQHSFTPEEAYQTAVERARRQLQMEMAPDKVFVRESCGMRRTAEDGAVQAEVVWIVDEPIGEIRQVPLPEGVQGEEAK